MRIRDVISDQATQPPFELTDEVLSAHLLRIGDDLAGAMLNLRPAAVDTRPDPAAAYDRLHHAVSDLVGVYNFAQLGARVPSKRQAVLRAWRRCFAA